VCGCFAIAKVFWVFVKVQTIFWSVVQKLSVSCELVCQAKIKI